MQLGIVTYMIAARWSVDRIIEVLEMVGMRGVELRSGHRHGVEDRLDATQRQRVRQLFERSNVELVGLGTAFEFDAPDAAVVRRNVEGAKRYVELAHDVGAYGIKVRPNRLHIDRGIPAARTIAQIAAALQELGEYGVGFGVKIRVEVHGRGTSQIPVMQQIMQRVGHPNVVVCWNSNPTDLDSPKAAAGHGTIRGNFARLKRWIEIVHIHDLYDERYPYRELFGLLAEAGFDGYTLAEIPACRCDEDAVRVLRYYRALWEQLRGQAAGER